MATTVAAVLVDGDAANLGHVGDSRIYLFSEGQLTQLTSDHSWVNEQIQSGVISADQARSHPLRNVVTRALGGKPDLAGRHAGPQHAGRGRPADLLGRAHHHGPRRGHRPRPAPRRAATSSKAATDLVAEANARGGEDNITVVLLKFEE